MSERQELIERLYHDGEYRPTGVFILFNPAHHVLVYQSAFDAAYWGFPQGGIEPGESLERNMERELREEVGINAQTELEKVQYGIEVALLDAEMERQGQRQFQRGKAYFFSAAHYIGEGVLALNQQEIAAIRWVDVGEARKLFYSGRVEKAQVMEKALQKAKGVMMP